MGLPYLPEDLWRSEILTRLPVKSVLSCKYVCKSLYSLIETHDFQQLHLRIFNNNNPLDRNNFYMYTRTQKRVIDTRIIYNKSEICSQVKLPIRVTRVVRPHCHGYVDGILLAQRLRDSDEVQDDIISLWNPSINKGLYITIPNYERLKVFGFGLDTVTSSYKVVGFYMEQQQQLTSPPTTYYHLNYNVYDVGHGTWSSDRRAILDIYVNEPRVLWMTYFQGTIYWTCKRVDIDNATYCEDYLLGFNLTDEQFTYLRLPKDADDINTKFRASSHENWPTRLSVSNRKLIFSSFCKLEHVCVWEKENESWVKLLEVDLGFELWRSLGKMNGGQVFRSSSDNSTMVHLHFDKLVCVYQQSLVLIEQFIRHSNHRMDVQLIHSLAWCHLPVIRIDLGSGEVTTIT